MKYRLRITDGYTHAEEFSAGSHAEFLPELSDALERFQKRARKPAT